MKPNILREKLTAWDAKLNPTAALTDRQKDGFMELTTLSANRPLPAVVLLLHNETLTVAVLLLAAGR